MSFLQSLLEVLEDLSASPWFYVAIISIAFLDSVFPIVPSETTLILGGAAAGAGELSIWFVIVLGAIGAFLGDSTAYFVGHKLSGVVKRIFFRGPSGDEKLEKLGAQIAKRGGLLLITARFIPGGRTALTIACGTTAQPFAKWFVRWDIAAVSIWAVYAGGLGFIYGQRFDHSTAFLLAFGTALGFTLVVEIVQRFRHRSAPADQVFDDASDNPLA